MVDMDVGTADVTCVLTDGVLHVTLSRPESGNAFTRAMLEGLAYAIEFAETSDDVRVVVLSGAGTTFCSGGDVALMAQGKTVFGESDDLEGRTAVQSDLQRRTVVRLFELQKPTVAVLPGAAVGAGLALALACDIRLAASSAVLATGFSRISLAGDYGCSWLLHRVTSHAVAKQMLYRPGAVRAEDAKTLNLVNEVVPDDVLPERAAAVSRALSRISPAAVAVMEETARLATELTFAEACDRDAYTHVRLTRTPEHRAAIQDLFRTMKGT